MYVLIHINDIPMCSYLVGNAVRLLHLDLGGFFKEIVNLLKIIKCCSCFSWQVSEQLRQANAPARVSSNKKQKTKSK